MPNYNKPHRFYAGVDWHARSMFVHVLSAKGKTVFERDLPAEPDAFLGAVKPFRKNLVVGCECMFAWYWLADLCEDQRIPFVLGHALAMKHIHGGKAKSDKIDAGKLAAMLQRDLTCQHSIQRLVTHLHSIRHAGRHRRIAIRLRSILDRGRQVRDPVGLVERDRDNRRFTSHRSKVAVARVVDLRMHYLRMQRDLQPLSREPKLLAILVASPTPAILPTHMSRHLAHRHRPSGHGR